MFFVTSIVTAIWRHDYLVEPPLVCGDGHHGLLTGVEDPLGPLGCLTCDGQYDGLVQGHARLSEEVLLQLYVVDPVDEQAEVTVGVDSLASHVSADQLHLTLPGLGLQVCQEVLDRLTRVLLDPVQLSHPGLNGMLGHAAGGDVVKELRLRKVHHLLPQAAE